MDDAEQNWYEIKLPAKKLSLREQVRGSDSLDAISTYVSEAKGVYNRRCAGKKSGAAGDAKWLDQMTKEGTTHDRIAAITMQLSSPKKLPNSLQLLSDLVSMCGRSGHSSRKATDALIELFTEKIMPPDRKLKPITTRNFKELPDSMKDREQVLFFWQVEDVIKAQFSKFLEILREGTNSSVESVKGYCIKAIYLLLTKVPEEERSLLTLLVNKLGDIVPKMATRAVHYLLQLLRDHPTMRVVVVKELETFMFRKNNTLKAQHYAVTILSQIMLSRADHELPQKLLELYFALFSKAASTQSLDNRLVNGILTGIRRAFPFSRHETTNMEKYYTPLFSIAAVSAFPHRVAALTIIFQVVEKGEKQLVHRFYNSLYNLVLASPINTHNMTATKLALFFSLLYKAIKFDSDEARVLAFTHRLLQICLQQKPSYVCGALFLVSEVLKERPDLHPHFTRQGPLLPPSITAMPDKSKTEQEEEEEEEEAKDSSDEDELEGFSAVAGKAKKVASKPGREVVRNNTILLYADDEQYDANARNPCASRAEGDPLEDFTLQAFLDAFSFKNPKKKHVQTIRDDMNAALRRPTSRRQTLVHDAAAFTDLPASKVDIQDAYLFKYLKGKRDKILEQKPDSDSESDAGIPDEPLQQDSDAESVDSFTKKYVKFSYDDMDKDRNVLADLQQDQLGATDEAVDADAVLKDALRGRDALDDESISEGDLPEDDPNADDEEEEESEAEPDFEGAVKAGEENDEELDEDMMAEMDKGRNMVTAVPELEEEADGSDMDDMGMGMGYDESSDGDDDDDDDDSEEPVKKKRKVDSHSRAYDVTKGSLASAGKADPADFASIIESSSKIGTSKYDKWLDKQDNRGLGFEYVY